jgi:hypothetical protein
MTKQPTQAQRAEFSRLRAFAAAMLADYEHGATRQP